MEFSRRVLKIEQRVYTGFILPSQDQKEIYSQAW